MELTGEQQLALPKARVWEALNDPEILKRCLPGCDVFERDGDDRYKVGMVASVGPVKARFNGKLTLSDIQPPNSYALAFDGSGGAAGFGKGQAKVQLSDVAGGTRLAYTANAQVGGKLAQVGARLIDGVARKMADEFFSRFARAVEEGAAPALASSPAASVPASASASATAPQAPAPVAAPSAAAEAATSARLEATYAAPTRPAFAAPVAAPQAAPTPMASPAPEAGMSRNIAVLAAAVSALGAAVAVLAAAVAMYAMH